MVFESPFQGQIYEFSYVSQKWHIFVVVVFCFFGGGMCQGACSAGKADIKVLNDIFLQRTSSFWTIISVQMKFFFNKVWENIDAVVLKISHK